MAKEIGEYAQSNGLEGDLAKRIQRLLRTKTGESLTPKELAWCNSFCQNLPDLNELASERVVKLLAEDYENRFMTSKKRQENSSSKNKKKRK